MSKKKHKKRNPQPAQPLVRLSQCMIVKNEEKNIETALSWAKGIAFEQIVVDTGSTDRTVEIAEKMGAKVYHFEWIKDFAAAKNYAIEQASGNWIAFLDADEYFSREDANKMMGHIRRIQADPQLRANWLVLHCPWVQVDDEGKASAINEQGRVFRNLPTVRYVGRIHEILSVQSENTVRADDIAIMHTGYTDAAYEETGKLNRNIDILRAELAEKPDDLNLKGYLADSLKSQADEESLAETESLFREVLGGGEEVFPALKKRAYMFLMDMRASSAEDLLKREETALKALDEFPGDLDLEYYYASILNAKGDHRTAWDILQGCEVKMLRAGSLEDSEVATTKPMLLFNQLVLAANGLDDVEGVIKYATMTLTADKTQDRVLRPYIATLLKNKVTEEELIGLLAKLYDYSSPRDLMFIARAAKDCGALNFARAVMDMASSMLEGH